MWVGLFTALLAWYFSRPVVLLLGALLWLYGYAPHVSIARVAAPQLVYPEPCAKGGAPQISPDAELDAALHKMIGAILKSYVLSWHEKISPDVNSFPNVLNDTLASTFRELETKIRVLDWPSFMVHSLLPVVNSHLKAFAAADLQIRQSGQYTRLSETETLQARIVEAYGASNSLHPHINNPEVTLLAVSEKLALLLVPSDLLAYKPAHNFINSLLGAVLLPVVNLLSTPDFVNQHIVRGCESSLRDSARVHRLRKMVQLSLSNQLPPMTLETDSKGYQDYLAALENIESLALARQTMYSIKVLISKLRNLEGNYKVYKERLENSLQVLSMRIKVLDPHSLDEVAKFDYNSVLSSPECLQLFEEYMRCQPFDCLSVYNALARLDTSVDPLGGFEIQTPEAIEANVEIVGEIYEALSCQTVCELDLDTLRAFLGSPTHPNYTEVQRVSWQLRDVLLQILQESVEDFKKSVYFDQYMAVAGHRRDSVDKLQTDDIEHEGDIINNEVVRSAIEDAMLDDPEEPEYFAEPRQPHESVEAKIQQFKTQIELLKPLISKAELTNDLSELRILHKSTRSLEREIGRLKLVATHQTARNLEQCTMSIDSFETSTDSNGEFIYYVVAVQTPSSSWTVARRYRQFYSLQKILKVDLPALENVRFPRKKVVLKFQQRQFVQYRKQTLEAWIREAYNMGKDHPALRSFLTDEAFSGTFDQPTSMVQPICDLFLTLFNENNELRGKAIVLILQQILGGTIEKRIKEMGATVPSSIPGWINSAVDSLWPEVPRQSPQRTLAERIYARDHAALLLPKVTKIWLGRIVGASNCEFACRTLLDTLQNTMLNRHLILVILESLVDFIARGNIDRSLHSPPPTPVL